MRKEFWCYFHNTLETFCKSTVCCTRCYTPICSGYALADKETVAIVCGLDSCQVDFFQNYKNQLDLEVLEG